MKTLQNAQLILMRGQQIERIKTYREMHIAEVGRERIEITVDYTNPGKGFEADRFIIKKGLDIIRAGLLPYRIKIDNGDVLQLHCITEITDFRKG